MYMKFQVLGTSNHWFISLALVVAALLATPQPAQAQLARRVKDINTTTSSAGSNPSSGIQIGNITYFNANDGVNGTELWRTDGTPGGTWLVKDIRLGSGSSSPALMTNLNGTLIFAASNEINGRGIWKSDGTAAGTSLLKGFSNVRPPLDLTAAGNYVYFRVDDEAHGSELWR